MSRFIVIAIVWLVLLFGVIEAGIYHFLGWHGAVAAPVILALVVLGGRFFGGRLIRWLFMIPFRAKARVLHRATMEVHSVRQVVVVKRMEIAERREVAVDADSGETIGPAPDESDAESPSDEDSADSTAQDNDGDDENEELRHFYEFDVTITPQDHMAGRVWEPGEFIPVARPGMRLENLEDESVGYLHDCRVWDGSAFGPDDPGKYPGQQRLKLTFGFKPGTTKAWVYYYNEILGQIDIPEYKP
jgi:hypothetical protein